MMSFRKKIYILILPIFFSFLWLYLNRNYLLDINKEGIQGLIYLTSSYAGYNFLGSQGTVYTLLYLLLLNEYLPNYNLQYLVRMKRTSFLFYIYKRILCSSLLFVTIFVGVGTLFTTLFINQELLVSSGYYIGVIISFILLELYYFFTGTFFCLLDTFFFSKTKSLIIAFLLLVFLTYLPNFFNIWMPINILVVFDLLFVDKLYVMNVLFEVIKIMLIIFFIWYVTLKVFKDKDVFHETS